MSFFSEFGSKIAKEGGKALDNLFTSKHEIAITDNQRLEITAGLETSLAAIVSDAEAGLEQELTKRLEADMNSDSWLSKNIRPLGLIYVTVTVSIMAFKSIFDEGLTEHQIQALGIWVPMYGGLMLTMYAFYYGGRSMEKMGGHMKRIKEWWKK